MYIAGKMVVVRSIERHLHLISVYPSGHPLKDVNEEITFTHQMVRLLLVEQIYRAFKINRGEKYHW